MTNARLVIGIFIILLGLSSLFGFPFFKIAFALFLIYIGISILTGRRGRRWELGKTIGSENVFKKVLIFSGIDERSESRNFQKAEIVAIFGGGEIDLRGVKTSATKIPIDVVAIFGGLKILVPKDWDVTSEAVGILGSMNNQTKSVAKKGPKVILKGVAILGGVDVVS